MDYYEGDISENPVSAEDIAGISKDDVVSDSDEKLKSPHLEIPLDIQNTFEQGNKGHVKEYDKGRLFKVQAGHSGDSLADNLTQRTFSRYRYVTNKFMENALEFSTGSQLQVEKNGNFYVQRADVYPLGSRGIESDLPISLSKVEGKLAFGTPISDYRVLEVDYGEKGELTKVLLWPTTGGAEESLTAGTLTESQDPTKSPSELVAEEEAPVLWGNMAYDHSDFSGYFRHNYTEMALRYNQNGDLTWSWDAEHPDSEVKTLKDELGEIVMGGQRIQVVNTSDQLKLIFYKKDQPDDVEIELTVPKHQEIVDFETGTETEQRFAFEEDLIPENIRKNPRQPYHPTDEIWRSANLTQLLNLKIEQRSIR